MEQRDDSRWLRSIAHLEPGVAAEAEAWLQSRPPAIQELILRFPPSTRIQLPNGGPVVWIVAYNEVKDGPPGLVVSPVDLGTNYEAAIAHRFPICAHHFDELVD